MTAQLTEPPLTGSVSSRFEIRDVETDSKLTRLAGRAVPYNTAVDIGQFTEEFTRGAFSKSIRQAARGLPLLIWHDDRAWPVGVSEEWRDELDGLHGMWRLDDGAEAQRAARMARDGMLSYMSVRFQQIEGGLRMDNTRAKPHFIREQARLIETSLTATPAYIDSTVTWVRSQPAEPPARHEKQKWQAILREIKDSAPYSS